MNVLFTKQQAHDEIECIFRELLPQNGMAQRPEQIRLCHSMLDAMLDGSIALCDAGTGIGKTFAYLVAGIMLEKYRSAEGEPRRPVLISTSSIALQNAIQNEYLLFLSSVLLAHGLIDRPIQAVIRKGKSHYACDMRLDRRIRQVKMSHKNPKAGYALLSAKQVLDLDKLSGMSGYDRERVCVPQHCACGKENCRYRRFLEECRNGQYTIQICNHNLLLADMIHRSRQKRPILRDSAVYIIDEAHKLPETARQMFGVTLAADDLTDLIRRLRTERFVLAAELLAESAQPLLDKLSTPVEEGEDFEAYRTLLESPHHILTVIHRQLNRLLSGETWRCLMTVSAAVSLFCEGNQDMIFYATDREKGGSMLCGTVSDLTTQLRQTLWCVEQPMILTSGTLSVGQDFGRFRAATGLSANRRVVESVSPSPFDYRKNCLLYLSPAPLKFGENNVVYYYDELAVQISDLAKASHGHALVLFTSYIAMSAVKDRLREMDLPYPVFTMGRNPSQILTEFRATPGSILLATGAAWEGMDFPGDCVSMLIIPRLPFAYPDAVKEKERENYPTLRAFIQAVVVPEMQIKLKQGFGRAIRTESDTCVVAVLDSRAARGHRYFEAMREALPDMPVTSSLRETARFYRAKKDAAYFGGTSHENL